MKAGVATKNSISRQCSQCRRVVKEGQAYLEQSAGWGSGTYWHRDCIVGLLKKTEKDAAKATVEVQTPQKLEEKFNALREQIAAGESKLV